MASVLVIDDEDLVRFTVSLVLTRAGHQVSTARNGREGIEAQCAAPFDLVITDIIMPEMEGLETVTTLRQRHPHLAIIAMSGGGRTRNMDYLKMSRVMGAGQTLAKPFSDEELLAVVDTALAARQ